MARPKRVVRAQRSRRERQMRFNTVKARIEVSLRRTLCGRDYALLADDIYLQELEDVSVMISEAELSLENEVMAFFPNEGMTQEQVRAFKEWLKGDLGEPIEECLEWCRFIIRSFLRCASCRDGAPILLDSDSDAE